MAKEWTAQNGYTYHGQEIETWKSDSDEWGFAYGIELHNCLIVETIVVGFGTEELAKEAALKHCYDFAMESAASQEEDDARWNN